MVFNKKMCSLLYVFSTYSFATEPFAATLVDNPAQNVAIAPTAVHPSQAGNQFDAIQRKLEQIEQRQQSIEKTIKANTEALKINNKAAIATTTIAGTAMAGPVFNALAKIDEVMNRYKSFGLRFIKHQDGSATQTTLEKIKKISFPLLNEKELYKMSAKEVRTLSHLAQPVAAKATTSKRMGARLKRATKRTMAF